VARLRTLAEWRERALQHEHLWRDSPDANERNDFLEHQAGLPTARQRAVDERVLRDYVARNDIDAYQSALDSLLAEGAPTLGHGGLSRIWMRSSYDQPARISREAFDFQRVILHAVETDIIPEAHIESVGAVGFPCSIEQPNPHLERRLRELLCERIDASNEREYWRMSHNANERPAVPTARTKDQALNHARAILRTPERFDPLTPPAASTVTVTVPTHAGVVAELAEHLAETPGVMHTRLVAERASAGRIGYAVEIEKAVRSGRNARPTRVIFRAAIYRPTSDDQVLSDPDSAMRMIRERLRTRHIDHLFDDEAINEAARTCGVNHSLPQRNDKRIAFDRGVPDHARRAPRITGPASSVLGPDTCAHTHAAWKRAARPDAHILICDDCHRRVAVVPAHRLPDDDERLRTLDRERHARREWVYQRLFDPQRAPREPLSFDALRSRDGVASLNPSDYASQADTAAQAARITSAGHLLRQRRRVRLPDYNT
jgi:hypothetical protein